MSKFKEKQLTDEGIIMKALAHDYKTAVCTVEDCQELVYEATGEMPSKYSVQQILKKHTKAKNLSEKALGGRHGKRIGFFKVYDEKAHRQRRKLDRSPILKPKTQKTQKLLVAVKKPEAVPAPVLPVADQLHPEAEKIIAEHMEQTGLSRTTVIENALYNLKLGIKTENSDAIVEMIQVVQGGVSDLQTKIGSLHDDWFHLSSQPALQAVAG